ncbi:MAG: hypothetical protein AAF823_11720 [Planctomycetota bacterium]
MTDAATEHNAGPNPPGLRPGGDASANVAALQAALDRGGDVVIGVPGVYDVNDTLLIGGGTSLRCAAGVVLRKVADPEPFTHVLLNRGALSGAVDRGIQVENLKVCVNGVDRVMREVYGLRGQVAFFRVADLTMIGFRCDDLDNMQFCVHVCDFEDVLIHDVMIRGGKDGVHFGRGRRFTVSRGVFATRDDAIALNAQDYTTSNPTRGDIEDGLITDCYDLPSPQGIGEQVGYFCRVLAGAWVDWFEGMPVRHSDTVVTGGRVYRVEGEPGEAERPSVTRPTHEAGVAELDGIRWSVMQPAAGYSAVVRRVVFRDIRLRAPRAGIALHCDSGRFCRGYYPKGELPVQADLTIESTSVASDHGHPMLSLSTPVNRLRLRGCDFGQVPVSTGNNGGLPPWTGSRIDVRDCVATPDLDHAFAAVRDDPRYELAVDC